MERIFFRHIVFLLVIVATGCDVAPRHATSLSDVKLDSYHSFYDLTVSNAIVKNMYVKGKLAANTSKFHDLTVEGSSYLQDSNISRDLHINGDSNLDNVVVKGKINGEGNLTIASSFVEEIAVTADKLYIKQSVVNNILILGTNRTKITLTGDTKVLGDIIFTAKTGEVKLASTAKVNGTIRSLTKDNKNIKIAELVESEQDSCSSN